MILAIVGTRSFGNPKGLAYARILISSEVWSTRWAGFVTGDAPGVDTLVREICEEADCPCEVLRPEHRRWEPDGYKARNAAIAATADEMLCIRDPGSATYGSGWTADHMETLGKPVTRVLIS